MVTDTLIRALLALLGEFSKKAGDGVASVFPATDQIGEIAIKMAGLLTWFALGKCASSQLTLHGARPYSYLLGNGGLTQTVLAQSDDLRVSGQTLLALVVLKTLQLWGGSGCSFGLPNRCLRISHGVCLMSMLSRQMMGQKPFSRLSEIFVA